MQEREKDVSARLCAAQGFLFSLVRMRARAQKEKEKKNARVKETFGSAEGFTDERKSHVCMDVDTRKREWVDVL